MCRYAQMPYKHHYACFDCRYSFKRQHPGRWCRAEATETAPCPRCGRDAIRLGHDFAAPRHADERAWRVLKMVVDAGKRFDSCGCEGPGYRPRTVHEARRLAA